jgi:serine/threonine-protein kinase
VKPQNVLIDPDGRAKVTDFGISRSLDDAGLTATGRVLGTTDYVAPEQALGEETTEQSDLYSLGICLFEMLTGEVPYTAESQVGVAMKHVRDPLPNVQDRRPEISSALCAVIERATAKETRNRYATAGDMVADLERALQVEAGRGGTTNGEATSILSALPPGTADFAPPRRRFPFGWVALILGVLAVAGIATYLILGADLDGEPEPAESAAPAPLRAAKLIGSDDFDPLGSGGTEHPEEVANVRDDSKSTTWSTETYEGGVFPVGKTGVGIVVWAQDAVRARRIEVLSPTQGYTARVYGANNRTPTSLDEWGEPLATIKGDGERERATLPGKKFTHYLVWITKLPPTGSVEIADIRVLE